MDNRNLGNKFDVQFPLNPVPKNLIVSPRIGVIPDYEVQECCNFFLKKPWNEINRKLLATEKSDLSCYLTPEGFAYYLPCLFLASAEYVSSDLGFSLLELFISQPKWFSEIISSLSNIQTKLLYDSIMIDLNHRYGDWLESDIELKSYVTKIENLLVK